MYVNTLEAEYRAYHASLLILMTTFDYCYSCFFFSFNLYYDLSKERTINRAQFLRFSSIWNKTKLLCHCHPRMINPLSNNCKWMNECVTHNICFHDSSVWFLICRSCRFKSSWELLSFQFILKVKVFLCCWANWHAENLMKSCKGFISYLLPTINIKKADFNLDRSHEWHKNRPHLWNTFLLISHALLSSLELSSLITNPCLDRRFNGSE